jgi:hypothetical protein
MKLFGWFRRRQDGHEKQRRRWREAWAAAIAREDASQAGTLKAELESLRMQPDDDVEVELEMLDALERVGTLRQQTADGSLPDVETHHRVVAGERCHFTAPATLPDDPAQTSGRLLFSTSRSVFVGGGRPQLVAWHTVRDVHHTDRDVVFVRVDGSPSAHFRFNTFADAVEAAFLARRLKGTRGTRGL